MKGTVEIYQHRRGVPEKIHEDSNMVVDGGREQIADMLVHRVQPSSLLERIEIANSDTSVAPAGASSFILGRSYITPYSIAGSDFSEEIAGTPGTGGISSGPLPQYPAISYGAHLVPWSYWNYPYGGSELQNRWGRYTSGTESFLRVSSTCADGQADPAVAYRVLRCGGPIAAGFSGSTAIAWDGLPLGGVSAKDVSLPNAGVFTSATDQYDGWSFARYKIKVLKGIKGSGSGGFYTIISGYGTGDKEASFYPTSGSAGGDATTVVKSDLWEGDDEWHEVSAIHHHHLTQAPDQKVSTIRRLIYFAPYASITDASGAVGANHNCEFMVKDVEWYELITDEQYDRMSVDNRKALAACNQIGNYQIKAMSLGAPQHAVSLNDSRYGIKHIHGDTEYLHVSAEGSGIYALRENLSNSVFSSALEESNIWPQKQLLRSPIIGRVVRTEGSPYVSLENELSVKKKYGQDVVVFDQPINVWGSCTFTLFGSSTAPMDVELIRQLKSSRLDNAFIGSEYYDFEKEVFTPSSTPLSFDPFDTHVSFEFIDMDMSDENSIMDRYQYILRYTLPKEDMYTLGEVTLVSMSQVTGDAKILKNGSWEDTHSVLYNSKFQEYEYDPEFPPDVVEDFGVVKIPGWYQYNPLASATNPIYEASGLGAVTIKNYPAGINGIVMEASSAPKNTGSSSLGGAAITTEFTFPAEAVDSYTIFSGSMGPYAPSMALQFEALIASANASGVEVSLHNLTRGVSYAFRPGTLYNRGEWGQDVPLVVSETNGNASLNIFSQVGEIINIPPTQIRDRYQITFTARETATLSQFSKYEIRNVNIGFLDGWRFGNFPAALNDDVVIKFPEQAIGGSGITMSGTTSTAVVGGERLQDTAYVAQKFSGLVPNKRYNLYLDVENLASATSDYGTLGVMLTHNDYVTDRYARTNILPCAGTLVHSHLPNFGGGGLLNHGYQRFFNAYSAPYASSVILSDTVDEDYRVQDDSWVHYYNPKEEFANTSEDFFMVPYVPAKAASRYRFVTTCMAASASNEALSTSGNVGFAWVIPSLTEQFKNLVYNFSSGSWDLATVNQARYPAETRTQGDVPIIDLTHSVDVLVSSVPKMTETFFESTVKAPIASQVSRDFLDSTGNFLLCPIFFLRTEERRLPIDQPISESTDRICTDLTDFNFYTKDSSLFGNYPAVHDTSAHAGLGVVETNFTYGGASNIGVQTTFRYATSRLYQYNFDEQTWDGMMNPPAQSTLQADRNHYLDYSISSIPLTATGQFKTVSTGLEERKTICLPLTNMDSFNTVLRNPFSADIYYSRPGASEDSLYTLTLIKADGGGMLIHDAKIVEVGTLAYTGDEDKNIRSLRASESVYSGIAISSPVGGWHINPRSAGGASPSSLAKISLSSIDNKDYLYTTPAIAASDTLLTLSHSDYVKDTGIIPGAVRASFDYFSDVSPSVGFSVKRASDDVVAQWNFSTSSWVANPDISRDSEWVQSASAFAYNAAYDDKDTNFLSNSLDIPEFRDDDVLTTNIWMGKGNPSAFRNLRYYNVLTATQVSSIFPSFPNPEERTVQPAVRGSGREGHFLNSIEYYGSGVNPETYERALYDGAHAPASGITFFSSTDGEPSTSYGNLNRFSVITPNGYILEQRRAPRGLAILPDSSCGFVLQNVSEHIDYGGSAFFLGQNIIDRVTLGSCGHGEGPLLTSSTTAIPPDAALVPSGAIFWRVPDGTDASNPVNIYTQQLLGCGSGINGASRKCIMVSADCNDFTTATTKAVHLTLSGSLVASANPAGDAGVNAHIKDLTEPGYYYVSCRFAAVSGDSYDQFIQWKEVTNTAGQVDAQAVTLVGNGDYRWGAHHQDQTTNGDPKQSASGSTSGSIEWFTASAVRYFSGTSDASSLFRNQLQVAPLRYTASKHSKTGAAGGDFTGWWSSATGKSIIAVDDIEIKYMHDVPQGTKLALTLSRPEWELLNSEYGGLGAIGAFAQDYYKTALKMGSDRGVGGPPFASGLDLPGGFPVYRQDSAARPTPVLSASGWPTSPPTRATSGVMGSEYLNVFCMRCKETDEEGRQGINRVISTRFGSPPGEHNLQGWASATGDYGLTFKYKVIDNPATPDVPIVNVQSAHFGASSLIVDNRWHTFSGTVPVTTETLGKNYIVWYFSLDDDRISGRNELYLKDVYLSHPDKTPVKLYAFDDPTDVSSFYASWSTPNAITHEHTYDGKFYDTSLYNSMELLESEPEFRLFAKKIFFPGGLQMASDSDAITIVWTITP